MATMSNLQKQWKPTEIHKRVKLGKFYKKFKPAKLFKVLKPFFKMLFPAAVSQQRQQPYTEDNLAFMTCIIKVNANRVGWQRTVLSVLRNCEGARFKMDQNGMVEVSGIADPNKMLKKLGRSRRVELHWFQFGQCSSNLFIPETKKNPVQENPNNNNPPRNGFSRYSHNGFPPYRGCGYYHYPSPQVFRQYAPY